MVVIFLAPVVNCAHTGGLEVLYFQFPWRQGISCLVFANCGVRDPGKGNTFYIYTYYNI